MNSEARKRAQEAAALRVVDHQSDPRQRQHERRREVMRDALAAVWSGADFTDADAVLDHLSDLGASVDVA